MDMPIIGEEMMEDSKSQDSIDKDIQDAQLDKAKIPEQDQNTVLFEGEGSDHEKKKSESEPVPRHHKEKHVKITKSQKETYERLAQERDLYLDSLRRLQADFENFKKRMIRERELFKQTLTEDLIMEMLPILDNFGHAINAASQSQDYQNLYSGIEMIYKQMLSLLESKEVVAIDTLGKNFDPQYHEAISCEYSDTPGDQIIDEMVKGYLLKGKLLRASKVRVSKGRPDDNPDPELAS
ncbi:MAG: nucleotide exchange factor GrpE [Chlamydiota bacterium]|nr:nucleotide exchange factor GrpE [Chlamydiota bacterium]